MAAATRELRAERLLERAAVEGWSQPRLEAALLMTHRLDAPATARRGKPCGNSYIPRGYQCRSGAPTTPGPAGALALRPAASRQVNWRRRVAIGAGLTAGALALGLPAASFVMSGSAPGRRASRSVENLARSTASGLRSWRGGPGSVVATPMEMGLGAAAEGIAAARGARSRVESWRFAPGFASEAARLGGAKARKSSERQRYIEQLQSAWQAQSKLATPRQLKQRAAQVAREQLKSERLARQAAVRMKAARRAARIARGGAPFRTSPTPLEAFTRRGLLNPSPGLRGRAERSAAATVAAALHQLQRSGRGLGRRRVRFYTDRMPRRDAQEGKRGKACGASYISQKLQCRKRSSEKPQKEGLTKRQLLGAAALAAGVTAGVVLWSKKDAQSLRDAMSRKAISSRKRKPNLVERLLQERREKRCRKGGRQDATPLGQLCEALQGSFSDLYLSKDGKTAFKVPAEPDMDAAKQEFSVHKAAYLSGVPTAEPLALSPKGVIKMEFLRGKTGEQLFPNGFDASRHPRLGLELSQIMRKMHLAGIAHNDLHYGNWMQTESGVKLIDWGQGAVGKKENVLFDIEDSHLAFGFGLATGKDGFVRQHPAVGDYDALVARTMKSLESARVGASDWRSAIKSHYDSLDQMLKKAAKNPAL